MGAAYAGITSLMGEADRGPAQFATAIGDHATGVTAAMSIGFALLHRERTGEGQYIERALSPSGRRAHWGVPIPRRRIHRDHGDAVSVEPDDQGDEHAGIGG